MTADEQDRVKSIINLHGFDYCFEHYSDFNEIEDKEFHKRKRTYLKAKEKFNSYIENGEPEAIIADTTTSKKKVGRPKKNTS